MSTSANSFAKLPRGPDVLGELLHSLSQPLTGLRCSLEFSLGSSLGLSLEEVAERQQESVVVALQQTEKVIGMIQLMREYLDAEQSGPEVHVAALAPALRSVIDELSSIAAVRGVGLRLVGTCTATVPVPESRLRLALQYLITTVIEAQAAGGKVILLLGEGPAGTALRAEGEGGREGNYNQPNFNLDDPSFRKIDHPRSAPSLPRRRTPSAATSSSESISTGSMSTGSVSTLRRVRLAIASRVLEAAGASLVFGGSDGNRNGFVLRIPHRVSTPVR